MPYPLANALYQWEEGARALNSIDDPKQRRLADRVISQIRLELRRKVGPTFTAEELADFYGQGTDWAQQIAIDVAPPAPPTLLSGTTSEVPATSPAAGRSRSS